jgi:hypothetical protein
LIAVASVRHHKKIILYSSPDVTRKLSTELPAQISFLEAQPSDLLRHPTLEVGFSERQLETDGNAA